MNAADAQLRGISVVIVANAYSPDVVYRDLVNSRIMPAGSKIVQSSQAIGGCEVGYGNGVYITVNTQRASIGKEYNEPLKDFLNDEVYTLAAEFVKAYNDMSYHAVGLNCTISLPHDDPLRWLTRKFLKAKSPPANVSMVPQFAIKTDGAILLLALTSGEESRNGQQKHFVGVNCNYHFDGPFKADADILRIVTGWRDTRDTILSKLGEMLELE